MKINLSLLFYLKKRKNYKNSPVDIDQINSKTNKNRLFFNMP